MDEALRFALAAMHRGDYGSALPILRDLALNKRSQDAQLRLAEIYSAGKGVANNPAEAFRWYLMAAKQGSVFAQYNVGYMYDNGRGVYRDKDESILWYIQAARGGNSAAKIALGPGYEMDIEQPNYHSEVAESTSAPKENKANICESIEELNPINDPDEVLASTTLREIIRRSNVSKTLYKISIYEEFNALLEMTALEFLIDDNENERNFTEINGIGMNVYLELESLVVALTTTLHRETRAARP